MVVFVGLQRVLVTAILCRPLQLLVSSNGLGPARINGNARCFVPIASVLLCNGLQAIVTNALLSI